MELAGLAIGALALVGTLNDCISLISQIAAAKSLGKDYELLNVKLDIQKTLLIQWGNRVGLFKRNAHDTRLDDPVTGTAVAKTLAAIRQLLNESGNLQQRYGVKPAWANELSKTDPIMSGTLSIRLKEETETLRHRIEAHSRSSLVQKARWAVHDKDKFDGLIQQLSFFISSLDNLVPDNYNSTVNALRDNLKNIHHIHRLELILQAASTSHNHCLMDLTREAISHRRILDLLWFRSTDDRKRNVEEAHAETLEWALNSPSADVPWDDLSG